MAKDLCKGTAFPTEGVDVVIETPPSYKAVAAKSGSSIFNAQSRRRQNQEFQALRGRMMKLQKHFEAVVGYSYGRKYSLPNENKIFTELAGQNFWDALTGDPECYIKIIEAMQDLPVRHKDRFDEEWAKAKNRFAKKFIIHFCHDDGMIDWNKLLKFNSGSKTNEP